MNRVLFHLASNLVLAAVAGWLTNLWLSAFASTQNESDAPNWLQFAHVASVCVFGATSMLFSTYHDCLGLSGAPAVVLRGSTTAILLGSWGYAGYFASMAFAEGLVFYAFLIPPAAFLSNYFESPADRPRQVVWADPFYSGILRTLKKFLRRLT